MDSTTRILFDVWNECDSQKDSWGVQRHPPGFWLGILAEELGEVAKETIEENGSEKLREELVQVAAVAVSWIEHLDEERGIRESESLALRRV